MTLNHLISPRNCSVVPGLRGIHLNDTNLKIGIWALNLERVMFFFMRQISESPKEERESPTHTWLALVHSSSWPLQHPVLRMTLQKKES